MIQISEILKVSAIIIWDTDLLVIEIKAFFVILKVWSRRGAGRKFSDIWSTKPLRGDSILRDLLKQPKFWKIRRHFMLDDPKKRKPTSDQNYDPLGSFRASFKYWVTTANEWWIPGKIICGDESNKTNGKKPRKQGMFSGQTGSTSHRDKFVKPAGDSRKP